MLHLGDITKINGKGSAVWCSEIEDFPSAVTIKRIE